MADEFVEREAVVDDRRHLLARIDRMERRLLQVAGIERQQLPVEGDALVRQRQPDAPGVGRSRGIVEIERHHFCSRVRHRYQLATVRYGRHFSPCLRERFGRRQLALAERLRIGLAQAVVVQWQDVGPAEPEHQEHLRAPAADAAHGDQPLDQCSVVERMRLVERRQLAAMDAAGEVLDGQHLGARQAAAAQVLVGGLQDMARREAILRAREQRLDPAVDRRRGLVRELLVDDRLGQRAEQAARGFELHRERSDGGDDRAERRIGGLEMPDRLLRIEAELSHGAGRDPRTEDRRSPPPRLRSRGCAAWWRRRHWPRSRPSCRRRPARDGRA